MKKVVYAEILTIGDEILYGQITNTNSQWIAQQLNQLGFKTIRQTTVGDNAQALREAFKQAEERVDLVIITGGLGPTNDDITKKMLAEHFEMSLVRDEPTMAWLQEWFEKRGRSMNEKNQAQALVPDRCHVLKNTIGTAPGMWFERAGCVFVSLPGVPREMKTLMDMCVLPRLKTHFDTPVIYHKILKTAGVPESVLAEKLENWESNLPNHITLAYLPRMGEVRLRLTGVGNDEATIENEINELVKRMTSIIGEHIYSHRNEDAITQIIGNLLTEQNKTITTAESCTGGYIAHLFTEHSGASAYYLGGVVAYDNQVKKDQLGVKDETLSKYGAVSEQTVIEMAQGVRERLASSIGIATTGVAGPKGGSAEKPVGTVWIAYADDKQTITKKLQLSPDRKINITLAAITLLEMTRKQLNKCL